MRVFIAMPFSKSFDLYWQAIQEICKKYELETFRVDKNLSYERNIDIAIRKEILQSDFMIALLTGDQVVQIPNPNVAYEVGYAHGIGKEVILLAESVQCLPFDFKQQRTCLYQSDIETFKQLLSQEIDLLKPKLEAETREKLRNFFAEISRCLSIIVGPEYRFFKEAIGYQEDRIWHGIYFFKDKYFLQYTISCGDDPSKVELQVWLADDQIRAEQKAFIRRSYDEIRRYLGYDVAIFLDEKKGIAPISLGASKNLILQSMAFETRNPSTKEALTVALKLKTWIEVLQPIFVEFAKIKGMELPTT